MTEAAVFLAGASRGVGREIARLLGHSRPVRAMIRQETDRAELEALGLEVVIGDALDPQSTQRAMGGRAFGAVISTIGGLPKDGQRADYLGNKHLIEAAAQVGVPKFILVSSIGSGDSAVALPPQALEALRPVLIEKAQAEQALIESGLTYVVIRPGGLKSEPATGNGVLTPDPKVAGTIHRADVAALVCQCLSSERANNQILSAVDRTMTYGQTEFGILSLD
ncbi:MAG: SDR family oxidoreductase [Elainella sp.]